MEMSIHVLAPSRDRTPLRPVKGLSLDLDLAIGIDGPNGGLIESVVSTVAVISYKFIVLSVSIILWLLGIP